MAWIIDISSNKLESMTPLLEKYEIDPTKITRIDYWTGQCHIDGKPIPPIFGYMAEASGIEPIIIALNSKKKYSLVTLHDSGITLLIKRNLRYDKKQEMVTGKEPLLKISFGIPAQTSLAQKAEVKKGTFSRSSASLTTIFQENANLVTAVLDSRLRLFTSLKSQAGSNPAITSQNEISRRAENILIRDFTMLKQEDLCESTLLVNESHPYFFDHPLDHLPGILLLEGAIQTLEKLLQNAGKPLYSTLFLRKIEIKFNKYAEKDLLTKILVRNVKDNSNQFFLDIMQNNINCCTISIDLKLHLRETLPSLNHISAKMPEIKIAKQDLLHKKQEANILTSEVEQVTSECYQAYSLPIPKQHFFQDGACNWLSPIYLMEIARQGMMQISHLVLNIPFGTPMNLFSIKFNLDLPIPRDTILKLTLKKESYFELNNATIGKISTEFSDLDGNIYGSILIGAQVINKEYYSEIRGQ